MAFLIPYPPESQGSESATANPTTCLPLSTCNANKHDDNFEGVESTSAIDTLLGEAQAVISRLDAAIQNKYRNAPDKLAAWKSASRTERPGKKTAAATPPPAP